MKKINPAVLSLLLAFSLPSGLLAASSDKEQPILIDADKLEVRDDENISTYSGNVRLRQGSMLIHADRMVIHFNNNKDLVLMEMTGNPATFRQLNDNNREILGQADKLDYHELESLLIFQDNARLESNGDTIESSMIRINTETDHIEAAGTEPDKRVRMIIQPKSKKEPQ